MPKLRKALNASSPGTRYEQQCWNEGKQWVAGVDEVGRGAWAGPLTVAAAVIPRERRIYKVRDSKMLKEPERELLYDRIIDWVEAWGVGHASEVECDELGMSAAQKLAAPAYQVGKNRWGRQIDLHPRTALAANRISHELQGR